jgi:hypothetical protein
MFLFDSQSHCVPDHRAAPQTAAKRDAIVSKALPMEVAMLADEGAFIGGVALTMTAITLLVSNWSQGAAVKGYHPD